MTVAARLRKLEAQATPGPWKTGGVFRHCVLHANGQHPGPPECRYDVVDAYEAPHQIHAPGDDHFVVAGNFDYEEGGIVRPTDAAAIVTVRNLLPLLADLAEAAERHDSDNDSGRDMRAADERLYAALARVADQLDHEEGRDG